MINFFLKTFVLLSGVLTTLALAVIVGLEVFDMFPGTITNGVFGSASYPAGDDYIIAVSTGVAIIIALFGFFLTTIAFERIADSE